MYNYDSPLLKSCPYRDVGSSGTTLHLACTLFSISHSVLNVCRQLSIDVIMLIFDLRSGSKCFCFFMEYHSGGDGGESIGIGGGNRRIDGGAGGRNRTRGHV